MEPKDLKVRKDEEVSHRWENLSELRQDSRIQKPFWVVLGCTWHPSVNERT